MPSIHDAPQTPRTPRAITQPRAETSGRLDRRDALEAMFHALDVNEDGKVFVDEVIDAACGVCPTMTEAEVHSWFRRMDISDAGFLDARDYVAGMLNATKGMTDAEFADAVRDTINRTHKKVRHPRYYFHRDDEHGISAREYLGKELTPLLEKALDALLRELQDERLRVATGRDWDADGYAPTEWRPVRPLRFLGTWLRENSAKGSRLRAEREAEAALRAEKARETAERALRNGRPEALCEMTREEKLVLCFRAMDRDGDGNLTFEETLRVCRDIDPGGGREEASSMVRWMDVNEDGQVDEREYVTALLGLMEHLDEDVFDVFVERVLTAARFANSARLEKLKMVFEKCDVDGDGYLDVEELRALAKALIVGGDEVKVERTMRWLDSNEDDKVSFDEFLGPLSRSTETVDDDRFDAAVKQILELRGDAKETDASEALHPKLAAFVAGFPTHHTTRQVSIAEFDGLLRDVKKRVAVVDCRSAGERNVSVLDLDSRGPVAARTCSAFALGDVAFVDAVDNNIAAIVEGSNDLMQTLQTFEPDVVVCVSTFGEESGVAAPLLGEKTGFSDVRSLCGGAAAWFNAGFALLDPSAGTATEALHPGTKPRQGFVRHPERRNAFKFPKEEGAT